MIISHRYRYLFVELARTGSTAISKELRLNYDGQKIMRKHSTYLDFLRQASEDEKSYFVFSCVRNPVDDAVSRYFKARNPYKRQKRQASGASRTDRPNRRERRARRRRGISRVLAKAFVRAAHADFPTFFRAFYVLPYANWSILSHKDFNFVIRFERLAADFEKALRLIGIEPVRPLPVVNKTDGRDADYLSYYTPEIIPHARWVFGPYMRLWGYEFPKEWG
jgi:hypothetical protein